jgi:hypothetical protein
LGERLLCKQEVVGSIPSGSTILFDDGAARPGRIRPFDEVPIPRRILRREFSLYDIVKRQIIRTFAPSNRSGCRLSPVLACKRGAIDTHIPG